MEETCECCGAAVQGGVEGCFTVFTEMLALEYSDPAYGAVHLLSVDAHALQHPEKHGYKNNAFHLIRLCWLLEYGGDARIGKGPRWMAASFDGRPDAPILEPPADRGPVTVLDVVGAATPEEHAIRVRRWARAVWEAWRDHHDWARQSIQDMMGSRC